MPGVTLVAASPNLGDTAVAEVIDVHQALRRALPPPHTYDVVLIGTPPALGHVVIASVAAADVVLVPVAAHALELDGLAAIHRTTATVQRRLNPQLGLRVLACRVDFRTRLAREVVDTLRVPHRSDGVPHASPSRWTPTWPTKSAMRSCGCTRSTSTPPCRPSPSRVRPAHTGRA